MTQPMDSPLRELVQYRALLKAHNDAWDAKYPGGSNDAEDIYQFDRDLRDYEERAVELAELIDGHTRGAARYIALQAKAAQLRLEFSNDDLLDEAYAQGVHDALLYLVGDVPASPELNSIIEGK